MNAVGATDAQGVLKLEGAALASLAEALDVVDDDVASLGDLVGQGRVAQVGGGHAVVHPAGRLVFALGNVGVNVVGHAGGKRDDVVVRHLLDFVDFFYGEVGVVHPAGRLVFALGNVGVNVVGHAGGKRDDVVVRHLLDFVDFFYGEVGVVADPLGLLARDARLTELGLGLAGQNLDLLPNGEFVLKFPDATHFRTSVATDHARFLSLAMCVLSLAMCGSLLRRLPKSPIYSLRNVQRSGKIQHYAEE